MDSLIYPSAPPYADPNTIPKIPVEQPAEYMPRKVLARVFAEGDEWTRSFHRDKAIALLDTLQYRRILLISDAGMGKTTELKQLAVALDQDNKYKRPVPIYLAYYNGGPVEGLLPQSYITLNPESLIYILDGYDEISEDRRTEFKKNLKQFLIKYSETQVLISMRSTFVPTTAELFSDFQCFHLMALEKDDVHCYLEQRGIDVPLFIRETRQKGLEKLLTIPFYLNVIVTIYSSKRSLPTQANLIEQLIQVTVRADNSKFEYSRSRTLSEEEHELIVALTRLAYGIQLLKKNYLSQEEYQTLLPAEKRRLAELSGVWRIQGDQYTFSHNNFREYLTAKHLATLPLPALLERIALTDGSAIERSYLQAWFTQLLDTLDLTTAVTEEEDYISPSWDLLYLLILWKQCKFACPESFYLGLLSVPVSFILESYQLEEKCALIEKMVPLKRIRERISANLQRPLQPTVLDEHFYYCKQYQMHDAKDLAIGLCKDTQRAGHKKREAAGYLYKVFGQELILNEILANADEELLLTLSSLLNDEWDERLEAAIVRQLRLKLNRCLLAKLIKMNSRQGLLLYWEDIKCNNRTPDRIVDDATDAIRNISDPALLPELLEMVEVRFSPGFKDGNFHSLSTSLFYALVACGKTEYDSVHTCMTALKENAAGSFGLVGFCSNVLNRLEKEREEGLARLWTLEEVKQELATIQ